MSRQTKFKENDWQNHRQIIICINYIEAVSLWVSTSEMVKRSSAGRDSRGFAQNTVGQFMQTTAHDDIIHQMMKKL